MKIILMTIVILLTLVGIFFILNYESESEIKEYEVTDGFAIQDLQTGEITLAHNSKIVEVKDG